MKLGRRVAATCCLTFLIAAWATGQQADLFGFAQTEGALGGLQQQAQTEAAENLLLAVSNRDYPATPGDTYQLTYTSALSMVTQELIVDSDYQVSINQLGTLDVEGFTLADMKRELSELVLSAYPGSAPSLQLTSVGIFQVLLRGEVPEAGYVATWGLARLSDVIEGALAATSSIRNVRVIRQGVSTRTYDLFLAVSSGEMDQNPLLRPGDVVEISRANRSVEVAGEVNRPGVYELTGREGFAELLAFFGGFSARADTTRIRFEQVTSDGIDHATRSWESLIDRETPSNGDRLVVPEKRGSLAVVFVEGAGLASVEADAIAAGGGPRPARIEVPVISGSTLYDVLVAVRDRIDNDADLGSGYVEQAATGRRIDVDLAPILYGGSVEDDFAVSPFDTVVIPATSRTAVISGAVSSGGIVDLSGSPRLSDILADRMNPYSSTRNVVVISAGGDKSSYDLFRATSEGNIDQNPAVHPGDTIVVSRVSRQISIEGEVFQPGRYELLPIEDMDDLEEFSGGYTPAADTSRVRITRFDDGDSQVLNVDISDDTATPVLRNGDTVMVPSIASREFSVFLRGGFETDDAGTATDEGTDIAVSVRNGTTLYDLLSRERARISEDADLQSGSLIRGSNAKTDSIDMRALLYAQNLELDVVLEPLDTIVLPVVQPKLIYLQGGIGPAEPGIHTDRIAVNIDPDATLFDVLTARRGQLTGDADLASGYVLRSTDRSAVRVDMRELLYAQDLSLDIDLEPLDTIVVPIIQPILVYLQGGIGAASSRPTSERVAHRVAPGTTLMQLLSNLRDTIADDADLEAGYVTRGETEERISVDMRELLYAQELSLDLELASTDTVVVPIVQPMLIYLKGGVSRPEAAAPSPGAETTPVRTNPGSSLYSILSDPRTFFSDDADLENGYVIRASGGDRLSVNMRDLLYSQDFKIDVTLEPLDTIVVPLVPQVVVYLQGGIGDVPEATGAASVQERVPHTIYAGTSLYELLAELRGTIRPDADLKSGYIARQDLDEPIRVDMQQLLYAADTSRDVMLEALDTIVIPYRRPTLTVIGAVTAAGEIPYNQPEIRLSDAVDGRLGPYSSQRTIEVVSADGRTGVYDLFLAVNEGLIKENPVLSPGDIVAVRRAARRVSIDGEVYRPGVYELLPEEDAVDLERFAGGLTAAADSNRVRVRRVVGDRATSYSLALSELHSDFPLEDGDSVTIPSKTARQPVIFLQGGIGPTAELEAEAAAPIESPTMGETDFLSKTAYDIYEGDTLFDVLYELRNTISPFADLPNGYVVREEADAVIRVDMEQLLYGRDYSIDIPMIASDTVVVPIRRAPVEVDPDTGEVIPEELFVLVTGGVYAPGRVPYELGASWRYYTNLAGGIDPERSTGRGISITSSSGEKKDIEAAIVPGDTIRVPLNSGLYIFNQFFPAVTAGIGFVTTLLTLIATLR